MSTQSVRRQRTVDVARCPACNHTHKRIDAQLLNKIHWLEDNDPCYVVCCPITEKHLKVKVRKVDA